MALLLFQPIRGVTMTATNPEPPRQKPSKVVPLSTRPAQPPVDRKSPPGQFTTIETHPADEPGYGHGV
jgi:hypothetical protein